MLEKSQVLIPAMYARRVFFTNPSCVVHVHLPENTHCCGTDHCTAGLQFYKFGFN